jgi:hypothetical protein
MAAASQANFERLSRPLGWVSSSGGTVASSSLWPATSATPILLAVDVARASDLARGFADAGVFDEVGSLAAGVSRICDVGVAEGTGLGVWVGTGVSTGSSGSVVLLAARGAAVVRKNEKSSMYRLVPFVPSGESITRSRAEWAVAGGAIPPVVA